MSRTSIPFTTGDVSALARSLRKQLSGHEGAPGHVEMLNMLARAAGYRNFQSLRAQMAAEERLERAQAETKPVDFVRVEAAARHFDPMGRMATWPVKASLQEVCLWVLWSRLPAREAMTEMRLNQVIRSSHLFGDHALLRRELCDRGLVSRTENGREYRRVEREPSPEGLALIRRISHNGRQS